jgi:tRNA threonylcarbamoyladenosine biosynthesis protein TsaB
MKKDVFLAIDTSTEFCHLTLRQDETLFSKSWLAPKQQLTKLTPELVALLDNAGLSWNELSAIAVTNGPGSYTGLRLGLITAKTIAQALNLPLYTFNTLDILAYNAYGTSAQIIPMLDARKREIFSAVYSFKPSKTDSLGTIERISNYSAYSPEDLVDFLKSMDQVILLGNALKAYAGQFKGFKALPPFKWYPKTSWMTMLASQLYHKGIKPHWSEAQAFYMRLPDAKEPKLDHRPSTVDY